MSTYVINNLIHFDNEAFVLYTTDAPEDTLRIGAIASRCLTQLLQANGQIVSKRDLMSGAWGTFGLEVTDNSLAQVVRQLRVALEKLQPDHELIITIPRIGYKISEQVTLLDGTAPAAQPPMPSAPAPNEPAPHSQMPVHSSKRQPDWTRDLLLGLGTIASALLLFQLPGLLRSPSLPEQPFDEYQVESIDTVWVHFENMPDSALKPDNQKLVAQAKQLAQALNMDAHDLHIYRFTEQQHSLNLLCQGRLHAPGSQCLGIQTDE